MVVVVELFEAMYRRSIQKYSVLGDSLAAPDPLRSQFRHALTEMLQLVVFYRKTLTEALL